MGANNPFPIGGMTPVQTASGQVQYQAAGGFSQSNPMDLLFNRKVVKPIRGGGPGGPNGRNSIRGGGGRESSNGRLSISNQVTFDQFMSNQKPGAQAQRGRASIGAMRSPSRGAPPLVKPDQQADFKKQMRSMSNKKGVAKQMKKYKDNMNASRQMVQQMKMQEAQALAEIPLEETLISESSSDDKSRGDDDSGGDSTPRNSDQEEEDKAEVERQIKKSRYASQGPTKAKREKASAKVYGGGQPIVPPSPNNNAGVAASG